MDELTALRAKAESDFNNLQTSINSINAELEKYGFKTIEEGMAELNRLQGEYRAYNKAIEGLPKPDSKKKISPKADVIDATVVDQGEKNGK